MSHTKIGEDVFRALAQIEMKLSNLWYVEMSDDVSYELRFSMLLPQANTNCLIFIPDSLPSRRICIVSESIDALKKSFEALCDEFQQRCTLRATASTIFSSKPMSDFTSSTHLFTTSSGNSAVYSLPSVPKSTAEEHKMELILESLKVKIYQKSILDVQVDTIVNAANEQLTHEVGISKTISEAGGHEYLKGCDTLLTMHGPNLKTCKVYDSRPGSLRDKFKVILHAVGPRWADYDEKDDCILMLIKTVKNVLKMADSLVITSLAMPAISSGYLGVPIEVCAACYIIGIVEFNHDCFPVYLQEVHFVDTDPKVVQELFMAFHLFQKDPMSISISTLKRIYPQYFGGRKQSISRGPPYPHKNASSSQILEFRAGEITVRVYQESILNVKADAVVNAANENLSHGAGVAFAISDAAGKEFDEECRRKLTVRNQSLKPTEVLETSPGNLKGNFKHILNAVGPRWDQYSDKTLCLGDLNQTIKNIMEKAEKLYVRSLVMPAISSGIFGVPLKLCAEMYLLGILEFSKQSPFFLKEVHIVDIDPSVLTELNAAYYQYKKDPLSITISSAKSRHPALMMTLTPSSFQEKPRSTDSPLQHESRKNHYSGSQSSVRYSEPKGAKCETTTSSSYVKNPMTSRHSCSKNLLRLPDESIGQQVVKVFEFQDVMTVRIYTGSIVRFQGDAIICSNDEGMSGIGPLATAIATAGGPKYSESYSKIRNKYGYGRIRGKQGDIETCSGGNLKVGFVVHAVISSIFNTDKNSLKAYGDALKIIFCTINNYRKSRKFAMPLIGAGQVEKSSEDLRKCCLTLFQVLADSCQDKQSNHAIKELHLINKNPTVTKSLVDVFTCNASKQADETVQTPSSYNRSRHSSKMMLGYEDKTPVNGHHGHLNRQLSWSQSHSGGITDDQNNVDFRETGARPKTEMARSKSMYTKRPNAGTGRKDKKENIEDLIARSSMSMGSYDNSEVIGKTTSSGKNDGNLKIIGLDDDSESNDSGDVDRNEDLDVVDETTTCVICLDDIKNGIKLTCGHEFCKGCLTQSFSKHKQACPVCGKIFGEVTGNQPPGEMTVERDRRPLPGYEGCGTITVKYKFNSGIQGRDHPNPGQPYDGTERRGFLPDNEEGRKVLRLLEKAFNRKLTFTIGYSRTTGKDDVVTWNDIHHKTKRDTGAQRFGYPDPTYLQRVQEELAAKGVTE